MALVLANAMHIKNVPARKTDVNDAMWIADLLAHGLIRSSFVPPTAIQELRTLMRTRKQLVREKVQHVQRIQKTLEDANLGIASVLSDMVGPSGRALLRALIAGETRPAELLAVTTERLHAPRATLLEALRGRIRPNHRFLLRLHLDQIVSLEKAFETIDAEVGSTLEPFRERAAHLRTMPGISDVLAQVIVSEIGGYLRAQFLCLRSPRKAVVAASMLTAAYYILRDNVDYHDRGADHFDRTERTRTARRLVRKLGDLGFHVEITETAMA